MITCPDCQGRKGHVAFVSRGESYRKHTHEWINCFTCGGAGEITERLAEAIEEGRKLAAERRERGVTLRQEAERLGVKPSELAHKEHPSVYDLQAERPVKQLKIGG